MAKLRHVQMASVCDANRAITPLLQALNARPFQKLPGSRFSVFTEIDAPALASLPLQPYENPPSGGEAGYNVDGRKLQVMHELAKD